MGPKALLGPFFLTAAEKHGILLSVGRRKAVPCIKSARTSAYYGETTGKGESIMEQFGNEFKKMLKAGLGAVAAGAEKAQEAIETLSKKGEPLYEQAKSAVSDAADKIRQAVNDSGIKDAMAGKPKAQEIIDEMRTMTREEWAQIRAALDEFEAQPPAEEAPDAAPADESAPDAAPQPDDDAGDPPMDFMDTED